MVIINSQYQSDLQKQLKCKTPGRTTLCIAVTAIFYALAAIAGYLLAEVGDFTSPLWPAAGVALAAILVLGNRVWPGVWLGCFAVVLWRDASLPGIALAACFATGVSLQALLGARLTRNFLDVTYPLSSERQIIRFLLLAGPFACLVSASVAMATQYGFGRLDETMLLSRWYVWWVGDTLGVLLFTPLVLHAWPGAGSFWPRGGSRVVLPLLVTAALLVTGHVTLKYLEKQRTQKHLENTADHIYESGVQGVPDVLDKLRGIERLFVSSETVNRQTFKTFVADIVRQPGIISVDWSPRITHAELASYTHKLNEQGDYGQSIFELNENLKPLPVKKRNEYFPVRFVEPFKDNREVIGLDHGFEAERRAAMERARDTGELSLEIVPLMRTQQQGMLAFLPVYHSDFISQKPSVQIRRESLRGYIVAVLDLKSLFNSLEQMAGHHKANYRVTDVTPGQPIRLLVDTLQEENVTVFREYEKIAGHTWLVEIFFPPSKLLNGLGVASRFYLGVSVLAAFLVVLSATSAAGRQLAVRAEVTERTNDLQQELNARQAAEKKLSDITEDLDITLHSIGDGVLATDTQGLITRINEVASKLTGWSLAEAIGKPIDEVFHIIHEKTRVPGENIVKNVLKTGKVRELANHTMLIARDGSERPIADSAAPIRDEAGNLRGAVLIFRDISEKYLAEKEMQRLNTELERRVVERTIALEDLAYKEHEIHAIVDNLPDAVIMINDQGLMENVNPALEELLGYRPEEVIGRNVAILMPEPFRSQHDSYIANYLRTGKAAIIGTSREVEGLHKDGGLVPLQLSIVEYQIHGQRYFVGTLRDIRERKQYEINLREREERLQRALQYAPYPIMLHADDGEVLLVNRVWSDITGYQPQEISTLEKWTRLAYGERAQAVQQEIQKLESSDSQSHEGEFEVTTREYGTRIWDFSTVPLGSLPDGRKLVISMASDVTEKKQHHHELVNAWQEAEKANRAKSAFLATMSHEIRTPMNGILGMMEILLHGDMNEQQMDALHIIQESALSLLSLIDDILDFSKIEAGHLELEIIEVDIANLFESVCYSLIPVAEKKDVDIILFIEPQLPEKVCTDPTRLRQLINNIVGNAIKFSGDRSKKQGKVEVRVTLTESDPARLIFIISDNGIGMKKDTIKHLFSAFSQAEISTTRRFGGTGLGLTICDRIVKKMQGEISVESSPGVGSKFKVTLPVQLGSRQVAPPPLELSGLKCVLVGGGEINMEYLQVYLEYSGAHALHAQNLNEASDITAMMNDEYIVIYDIAREPIVEINENIHTLFKGQHNIRYLLIKRGRKQSISMEAEDIVTINGNIFTPKYFISAVAITGGKSSSNIFIENDNEPVQDKSLTPFNISEKREKIRNILVVEDEVINQKVILRQLAILGYTADMSVNGVEAFQMWHKGKYDLMLVDLHMPEMDGYDLARNIRLEETEGSHIPIVALTADAMRGVVHHTRAAGMDDFLTKPIELDRLNAMLERWLPDNNLDITNPYKDNNNMDVVIDTDVLKKLIGDDDEIACSLLSEYLETARMQTNEIDQAFRDGDVNLVITNAHKLKSSSRSVGALAFGDVCAELENAGKAGNKNSIKKYMDKYRSIFSKMENEIIRILDGYD